MEAAAGCDKIQATKQWTGCPRAGAGRDQEIRIWRRTGLANRFLPRGEGHALKSGARVGVPYALPVSGLWAVDGAGRQWRACRMKFMIASVGLILLMADGNAGQSGGPAPTPLPVGSAADEIPTPSGTPQPQATPLLLPGSDQLPAAPPSLGPLQPPAPSLPGANSNTNPQAIKQLSPEERARNQARLAEIRAIAILNSRAVDLLKEANGALTDEAKREFMRAYYHTICTRMRELDPGIGQTISEFERSEIRKLASGPSHLSIVADLFPRKTHRQHRSE